MGRRWLAVLASAVVAGSAGCDDVDLSAVLGEEPSPFDIDGRRVGVITDSDAPLCAGSIERISREVDSTESALGIVPHDDLVEIDLYEADDILLKRCSNSTGCYRGYPRDRAIFERRDEIDGSPNYWVPFDRLDVEYFGDVPEFLRHGLANAMTDRACAVVQGDLDELMARSPSQGLTLGEAQSVGQLMRAVLRDHSTQQLHEWLAVLDSASPPAYIRASFDEIFSTSLDVTWDDSHAEPMIDPPGGWCSGVELPPDGLNPASWSFDARFDCADTRVEGDLELREAFAIVHAIYVPASGYLPLESPRGDLPDGTHVEFRRCNCSAVWQPVQAGSRPLVSEGWMEFRVNSDAVDGRRIALDFGPLEPF